MKVESLAGPHQILLDFYRKFDVNTVRCRGVHVWPLIRLWIWRILVTGDRACLQTPPALPRLPAPCAQPPHFAGAGEAKPEPCDFLLFCRTEELGDVFHGKTFNRLADPLYDLLSESGRAVKVEIASDKGVSRLPRWRDLVFLSPPALRQDAGFFEDRIEGYAAFAAACREHFGFSLPESFVLRQFHEVLTYRDYFSQVLRHFRPRSAFLVCWYFEMHMGLSWACRDENVVAVEFQHGAQGALHGLYTRWTTVPPGGYALMPRLFWNWSDANRENITRWFPADQGYHASVVGGHLWLSQWRSGFRPPLSPAALDFAQRLRKYSRVVLYTLQPLPEPVTPLLLEAMRRAPPDWIWLLRKHPLGNVDGLEEKLRAAGLRHFEMTECSRLPLFAVLSSTTHHISRHSSVCRESVVQGIPTGVIHPMGQEAYAQEIAAGLMRSIASPEALLAFVGESRETAARDLEKLICTDPGVARAAVETILGMAKPVSGVREEDAGGEPGLPLESAGPEPSENWPPEVSDWMERGKALRHSGSLPQAIGAFGEAFRIAPRSGAVAAALAEALETAGHAAVAAGVRRTVADAASLPIVERAGAPKRRMDYDRNVKMFDEPYTPAALAQMEKQGFAKGKFLRPEHSQSYLHQMTAIAGLPGLRRVLEIGPGEPFVARNLREIGLEYHTLDLIRGYDPTYMSGFQDFDPIALAGLYDAVCAFQVLEHMPYDLFPVNLLKLSVLSRRWVFISLPYSCRGHFRIYEEWNGQNRRLKREEEAAFEGTGIPNRKHRPEYIEEFPWAVHYWEIGREGYPLDRVRDDIEGLGLRVVREFHSPNPFHYFFLMEKT